MSLDAPDDVPSLFGGLIWLKPVASSRTEQDPAGRFALQPLSSNKPTVPSTTAPTAQFKCRTPVTAVKPQISSLSVAVHALQPDPQTRRQQQTAGQGLTARSSDTPAQPRGPLLTLTTKTAAAASALPIIQPSATTHPRAVCISKQHSSSPAQPAAAADSLFDFPTDDQENDSSHDQSPAAAEAPCQLSTLHKRPHQAAARTRVSKDTAQHPQQGPFKLPELDFFGSKDPGQQQHQHQQQGDAGGHARSAPSVQLAIHKSFRRSSKQTAGKSLKPSTAQHAASSLPALQLPTAATGRPAAALLPPLRPAAAAGTAGMAGALLPLLQPGAAATAAATGHSRAWLGLAGPFNITSADGELELFMDSLDPDAPSAAACAVSQHASQDYSWQQQQGLGKAGLLQEQLLLQVPGRGRLVLGTRQQEPGKQHSKALLSMSHNDDSAGMSQVSGSVGGSDCADSALDVQQAASSSCSDDRSSSESDADVAGPASSGSLWSASSDSSSGGEDAGSDSDASYLAAERSAKRARTGRAAGNSSSRAGGVKHLLQLQGRKRGGAAQGCEDDAAAVPGSKRHKHVRFADVLEVDEAAEPKQGQQQQPGCLQDAPDVLGLVKKGGTRKAAGCAAALDLGPAVPGEVPLLLQSAHSMMRSSVLLVELPAGFDAEGDAGAIGRVVCSSAGHAVSDAHAVARVADRPKQQQPAARKRKAGSAAAAAAAEGGSSSADDSSSEPLSDNEAGTASDTGSLGDAQHSGGDGVLDADDGPASGIPALDLKGMVYEVRELLLAGTAAVVRINPAGKGTGGKPASAHMEHLFTSFCSAAPAAAAAAADDDAGCDAGFEYDWEGCEDFEDQLPGGTSCGADGVCEQTVGVGKKGSKGGGRKGKGPAGGLAKSAGGAKRAKASAAAAVAGKRGSRGMGKKRAAGKGRGAGAGKGRAGAAAAGHGKGAAAGGKVGAASMAAAAGKDGGGKGGGMGSKKKQRDPWETDDDDSE